VDIRHHYNRILDFKIDNSYRRSGHYCTQRGRVY